MWGGPELGGLRGPVRGLENRGRLVCGNPQVRSLRVLQESRDPAFQAWLRVWLGQSRAASGCPPPASRPRWSVGPAGRSILPETGRSWAGPEPGLGSPGDGSGRLGSVGRSGCGRCVEAGCPGGWRARSLAIGHSELGKGWGSQDGWKEAVQRAPPGASPPPRPGHGRGARAVPGALTEHSWFQEKLGVRPGRRQGLWPESGGPGRGRVRPGVQKWP